MYNGIGLQTARGSGTNGYVQTNKFFVRPKTGRVAENSRGFEDDQGTAGVTKKANKDILEHDRKRQIELKLVVLEDKLTDQGYTDAEIAEKLEEARSTLLAAAALEDSGGAVVSNEKVSDTQTHQVAARKEKQMETLRAALGITVSGPEDALDLEPGEIKNEQPKNSRKYGRNEGEKGREKYSDGNGEKEVAGGKKLDDKYKRPKDDHSKSESESDQETRINIKLKSRKQERRKDDSSNSETDSEHETRGKSKSKSRKQKRRSDISSDTDSDGKKVRRSRKKSKRASKDAESDSDSDSLKKHNAKRRRRTSDSSDSDSGEKLKKRSKKKARHISKDIDSDSSSEDNSSFSDSSDSDTKKDKTRHVLKHISQSSKRREVVSSNSKKQGKQAHKKQQSTSEDDSSSESDSDDRVAVMQRRPVRQQRHDTDGDDSGSADDENVKRKMAARKVRSKNADDNVVGDNKKTKSYKEEEGRWEDRISDGKHRHGENKNEDNHSKRDKMREQENNSERMHDRYEDARNHRNDKFVADGVDGERHGQKNEREPRVMRRSGSDRREDNRENRQSDRFEEPHDKRQSDRNPEKIKDGNLSRSQVSDPERSSKRDEYDGRFRKDENRHDVRKMPARGEEREEAGRRHGRRGDVDSPKRARYDDDSRRYDRSRR